MRHCDTALFFFSTEKISVRRQHKTLFLFLAHLISKTNAVKYSLFDGSKSFSLFRGLDRTISAPLSSINVVRVSTRNLYLTTPELLLTCKKTETISRLGLPFVIQISPDVNEVSLLLQGTPNSSLMTKWLIYAIAIHHNRK